VPDNSPAFQRRVIPDQADLELAAKRRKNAAYGVSRGRGNVKENKPGRGESAIFSRSVLVVRSPVKPVGSARLF
jgi:hypothetical protein